MLPKEHLKALQDSVYPQKPHKKPISDEVAMQVILEHVARGLSPSAARRAAGISKQVFDRYCDTVEGYLQEIQYAYDQGSDYLEDLALLRAHENDIVLLKLLEARRPEKFSNKRQINAGVKVVINSLATPQQAVEVQATMIEAPEDA